MELIPIILGYSVVRPESVNLFVSVLCHPVMIADALFLKVFGEAYVTKAEFLRLHLCQVLVADKTENKAKQLYLAGGWTYAALAKKFKVSERTIIRWSKAGNWQALRDGQAIASQAIAEEVSEVLQQKVQARGVRPHFDSENPEAYIELALAVSYADLEDPEIRSKSRGEVISSIEKMLKLQHQISLQQFDKRLKQIEVETEEANLILKKRLVNPLTIGELADMATELGYTVKSFIEAMRDRQKNPQA